jgi:hypothetical protein
MAADISVYSEILLNRDDMVAGVEDWKRAISDLSNYVEKSNGRNLIGHSSFFHSEIAVSRNVCAARP